MIECASKALGVSRDLEFTVAKRPPPKKNTKLGGVTTVDLTPLVFQCCHACVTAAIMFQCFFKPGRIGQAPDAHEAVLAQREASSKA